MQRLYARPAFQAGGLRRQLGDATVREGRAAGYAAMRLDMVPTMIAAIGLYTSLGFVDSPPYRPNPIDEARHLELVLR